MVRYVMFLWMMLALTGCAGSPYYGGYVSPYYDAYPYYYDQLYGPPFTYPYPDVYYYSVPTPVPHPRFGGERFEGGHERGESRGGGESRRGGEHRGGGQRD